MFIVPETMPALFRPMSMQTDQDGASVMSAPSTARLSQATETSGVRAKAQPIDSHAPPGKSR